MTPGAAEAIRAIRQTYDDVSVEAPRLVAAIATYRNQPNQETK